MQLAIKQILLNFFWNAKRSIKREWLNNSSWSLKKKELRYTVSPSCLQSRTFVLYRQRTRELNCAEKRPTNSFIFKQRSYSFPPFYGTLLSGFICFCNLLLPSQPFPNLLWLTLVSLGDFKNNVGGGREGGKCSIWNSKRITHKTQRLLHYVCLKDPIKYKVWQAIKL